MSESARIVLLNGPSSSGKTTLSRATGDVLPTPWHILPVDIFHASRTRPDLHGAPVSEWPLAFRATRAGYHRALAGMARAGCDVLADHVLSEPWRLADLLEVTAGLDVLLVHVTCDPDVLERRERERGDREPGTARQQLDLVFAHGDCDLVVDTSSAPIEEAAAAVVELIESPPASRAFDRLRLVE